MCAARQRNATSAEENRKKMNVVKNMVHIWIGHKQPPLEWMNTWRDKHPDWAYRILDEEEYRDTEWVLQKQMDAYYNIGLYAGVADMIRYETLLSEGGFLPPADSVCLHPIDELLTEPSHFCYTVYENEELRGNYMSPFQAANPGNTLIQRVVETIYEYDPVEMSKIGPYKMTGNRFLNLFVKGQNYEKLGLKVWPSHYLIPQHFKSDTSYYGPDTVYAEQRWG